MREVVELLILTGVVGEGARKVLDDLKALETERKPR